jgi:hypothetical protein
MRINKLEIFSKIKSIIIEYKFFILFLVIAFWTLPLTTFLPTPGLDSSWVLGLNLAFLNHFPFGTSVVFPYGVLGFLGNPLLLNHNLWKISILFAIFTRFLFISSLYLILKNCSARWYHYIFFIPLLLFILPLIAPYWALLISISIILYLILIQNELAGMVYFYLIAIGILLAIDSLIKFDMLFNSVYLILGFCIINFIQKRDLRQSVVLVSSYIVSFLALWLIAQQHVSTILAYLIGGFELTKGYTEAMAIPGPFWQVCIGLISIILLLTIGIYFLIRKCKNGLLFLVLNLVILFSAFKSGFVRHDDHILEFLWVFILFFGIALIIVMNESKNSGDRGFIHIMIVVVIAVIIGTLIVLTYITAPWVLQSNIAYQVSSHELTFQLLSNQTYFDTMVAQQKEKIRSDYSVNDSLVNSIGNHSVDIFPWDIALCWAYDLNWTPRPVFQSYAAYTTYLDTINSQHFIDPENSPEKVFYTYTSIDGRYPLFDEPKTFRTILNNFSYAGESGTSILLNRSMNSIENKEVAIGSATSNMGEPIIIPTYEGEILGNITIKYSMQGNILKTVYKPAPVYIRFQLKNGFVSPRYRLIPGTASNGLFLSQYVSDTDTLAWIFQGHVINDIASIIIETDRPGDYQNDIYVQFVAIPHTVTPASSDLSYSQFYIKTGNPVGTSDQTSVSYAFKSIAGEIKPAIYEHAAIGGSQISVNDQLIPRNSSLNFGIALDSQTWFPDKGDGVEYQVYINSVTPENLIFSKYIDPKHNPDERKWNEYNVNLSHYAGQKVMLIFSTLPGPKNDTSWDWAWWGNPRIIN